MSVSISQALSISEQKVANVIKLFESGGTIPFIARYRKEVTGGLDEVDIAKIKSLHTEAVALDKRRKAIVNAIEAQNLLTADLTSKINGAETLQSLEDLYLPFKQKRKTRASIAVELGLEPLAKIIFEQNEPALGKVLQRYIKGGIITKVDALAGARDIIAEWVNEDVRVRNSVRSLFERTAILTAKVKKSKTSEAAKYKDYFDYSEPLKKVPSHRFLAINRGQEEGFLRVKIAVDNNQAINGVERRLIKKDGVYKCAEQVKEAIADAYSRLLLPSIEKEFEKKGKEIADKGAIDVFSTNLRQLLLSAPLGQKPIIAIDPGLRTGCKTVVLNELGDLQEDTVIYPLKSESESIQKISRLLTKYKSEAIAIGNGTGGREIENLIKAFLKSNKDFSHIAVHMVSEQGASIYSASEVAREEFPDKDITVRGAVSIGRRLKDPLAELVKIDPKSIGVGQYQHDVNPKLLKESLDEIVVSCVNQVGVELNTASKHLLSYVSGLGPSLAQNIVDYRSQNGKFTNRNQLKKVAKLGPKAFEQSAGFLRIHGAKNPLDNSAVHPETYSVVNQIAKDLNVTVQELIEDKTLQQKINPSNYTNENVGLLTLQDIISELAKPGRDPREQLEVFEFANVNSIEDLQIGMVLPGIITNITAFGCFVDIGVHQDGLVHISQITNKFIKDPNEVVSLNEKVQVKVTEIDIKRKRIGLSMKQV